MASNLYTLFGNKTRLFRGCGLAFCRGLGNLWNCDRPPLLVQLLLTPLELEALLGADDLALQVKGPIDALVVHAEEVVKILRRLPDKLRKTNERAYPNDVFIGRRAIHVQDLGRLI